MSANADAFRVTQGLIEREERERERRVRKREREREREERERERERNKQSNSQTMITTDTQLDTLFITKHHLAMPDQLIFVVVILQPTETTTYRNYIIYKRPTIEASLSETLLHH